MKIAVLGGGNGSFAAAGDFALGGHEVRLWRRDAKQVAAHQREGSRLFVKDVNGPHDISLALVTTDIAEAVREAELILCPAPAFAQADIAKQVASHLRDGQVVFLPPATFGSMIFARAANDAGNRASVSFAETGTLPWLTRKHDDGHQCRLWNRVDHHQQRIKERFDCAAAAHDQTERDRHRQRNTKADHHAA